MKRKRNAEYQFDTLHFPLQCRVCITPCLWVQEAQIETAIMIHAACSRRIICSPFWDRFNWETFIAIKPFRKFSKNIPTGFSAPTGWSLIPNRMNYIHWILYLGKRIFWKDSNGCFTELEAYPMRFNRIFCFLESPNVSDDVHPETRSFAVPLINSSLQFELHDPPTPEQTSLTRSSEAMFLAHFN